ncbi:L-rhamnose-binding lectin ELEL-1 [Elysia marginata]|uniref:L-rhamnose-binding lectin ELEL-1 n=1 Tax=Elysia marginata TaxID=1093978 RepID=A0AAV4G659_9GAST|nr:L-rhamnose-binding lectin ELEL-1 [Elysia marginata]
MQDKVKIWSNSLPNPITATVFFASLAFLPRLSYGLSALEHRTMSIFCQNGNTINILNAEYKSKDPHSTCTAVNAVTLVKDRCQGKDSCSLLASNTIYSDPCPHETKMLYVTYACGDGE